MPYQKLILRSGRDRSIRNRHPWLFSGAVKELPKASPGEIVEVRSNQEELLAYGFYNPNSRIVCRLFEFGETEIAIDDAYWIGKIVRAMEMRRPLLPTATDCFRLLHAEGDFLPGAIADVYGDVVVLQILIKGTERLLEPLLQGFRTVGLNKVYLKIKDAPERFEGVTLAKGWLTEERAEEGLLTVIEHGLRFHIDIERGQKTGFFLDQRENRKLVGEHSGGRRVLNAFSYTGGFSLYAAAGGATSIESVDVSADAVRMAEENVRLNFPDAGHEAIAADCFDYLRRDDRSYDLIVLDPPAFARSAKTVQNAARGYKDLNLNAIKRLAPGGLLFTFSCSQNVDRDLFRKIVFGAAADARRNVRVLHQLSQPFDHPINIYHPEGEYLKGLALHVE